MSERITYTLHELVAEINSYADSFLSRHYGVSYNLFELLAVLVEQAPTDITGLAQCLGISKAAVSKRLPSLSEWVVSTPSAGRRIVLTPTERARALVAEAGGELETRFARMFADSTMPGDTRPLAQISTELNNQLAALTRTIKEKDRP